MYRVCIPQILEQVPHHIPSFPHFPSPFLVPFQGPSLYRAGAGYRLKYLGLTRLESRRIRSDLIETYKIMTGVYNIPREIHVSFV